MRTFVRLRQMLASHGHLARKRPALADFIRAETNYDTPFKALFDAISKLIPSQQRQKQKKASRAANGKAQETNTATRWGEFPLDRSSS